MRFILIPALLLFTMLLTAQKPVQLIFDHEVDGIDLAFGQNYEHSYGMFSIYRLQYYLSNITLLHDGGQETDFKGEYLLVNGNKKAYDLGLASLSNVEGIKWNVGIDSTMNHSDPAFWPEGHPLAYQNPSTHWGWVSGYRFLCFEGLFDYNKDDVPEKIWEFHAVGDAVLTPVNVILTNVDLSGDTIKILLKANYSKLFKGVHIDNILHGDGTMVRDMMKNFTSGPVFTADAISSIPANAVESDVYFKIIGNPSISQATIEINNGGINSNAELVIYNTDGRQISSYLITPETSRIVTPHLDSGMYIIGLKRHDILLQYEKCVIIDYTR